MFQLRREAWLDGFTISEIDPVKLVGALIDQAFREAPETRGRRMHCDVRWTS